jgi:hypothetical protein
MIVAPPIKTHNPITSRREKMKQRWRKSITWAVISLLFSTSAALALNIEFSGTVASGGICTDIDPLPWTMESVVTWEDWSGMAFSGSISGTVESTWSGYYGGPAALMTVSHAELLVDGRPAIDILAGDYWIAGGTEVGLEFNGALDWVEINGQWDAEYLFNASAIPVPSLYIASQHDFDGDNINLGAWRLTASPGVSVSVVSEPVPEPATIFLLGTGLIGLAGGLKRSGKGRR